MQPLPSLRVTRAVWQPEPDLEISAEAWLPAGGPHHTVLSTALGLDEWADFAEIMSTVIASIDANITIRRFTRELRWDQAYYRIAQGL